MKKIVTFLFSAFVAHAALHGAAADSSAKAKPAKKVSPPEKHWRVELKIGDKYYSESYFYTAAEHYRDVVRQDSNSRRGCFGLAMALLQSRDYEGAETFFRQFYSIKPGE